MLHLPSEPLILFSYYSLDNLWAIQTFLSKVLPAVGQNLLKFCDFVCSG